MLKELATIDRERVRKLIASTNGKFFRVIFTKRTTGKLRTMDCRTHVKKFVSGGGLKFDPDAKDLVIVWDLRAYDPNGDKGYRSINLRTVREIHFAGQVHTFDKE